ncbi:T-cell receptor beta 2 [Clarias magur]|nr:T-cell receptor beta 2 [Clarias magur]
MASDFFSELVCCASGVNQAHFGGGTKLTVLDKDIKITPPAVRVLNVSQNEVCTKKNVTLVCLAERFYPDHVTVSWTVGGEKRTTDVGTDAAATQGEDKFYTISSRLNIEYKEWTKGQEFMCIVTFFDGSNTENYNSTITSLKVDDYEYHPEQYIRSGNMTKLAYGIFIVKSCVYGLFIMYIVKRQGHGGFSSRTNPNVNITSPSINLLPPSHEEICYAKKQGVKVTLVCLATDFYPDHINITWKVNGKDRNYSVATDQVAQQDPDTRLYIMSSRLSVNLTEWTNIRNKFTCIITFYDGNDYEKIQQTIRFIPE